MIGEGDELTQKELKKLIIKELTEMEIKDECLDMYDKLRRYLHNPEELK